jgi:cystathionine beta-lyase/cystathionine gamma-synthase
MTMKTPLRLIALAGCCLAATGAARNPASPVSDALRSTAHRAGNNLAAAAEEMPAAKYGYKPTPAQMSFGKVIVHLSDGNDYLCSKISGMAQPKRSELTAEAPKEKLVARLRETFQFCDTALAKVDDSNLGAKVPFFGGHEVSRAEAMFAAAEDWADHYSQLAIYLRLNGLLPPTAKQQQG